ncbi:MAG: IscS subfamily cysteine desulfurase [Bacteroidetes bacterium]|nr:IscS subfamily cysteine desulfurase [Bacteroidota bacterium]
MNPNPIYLDYNSTTPVDPQVLEAMLPYFTERFGNAASRTHAYGWVADEAVKIARKQIAKAIGAEEMEVIFTSGATEAINLAIKGVAESYAIKGKHIVTVATEHKAVLDTCKHLEKNGYELTTLPVMRDGLVDHDLLERSIRTDTILVAVMLANNETGVIQDLNSIGQIVHQKNSILFTDATQALGKINVDVNELYADIMSISAHKVYGPKGVGALYVRRKNPRVTLAPQIDGGGHERGFRSGTLNVPGIVGFGKACELATKNLFEENGRISLLRTRLEQALTENGKASVNGNIKNRLPNTSNICFHNLKADELIKACPELALSTGSACSSALAEPSHVLKAMGLSEKEAYGSVRFSIGRFTDDEQIEKAIQAILHYTKK